MQGRTAASGRGRNSSYTVAPSGSSLDAGLSVMTPCGGGDAAPPSDSDVRRLSSHVCMLPAAACTASTYRTQSPPPAWCLRQQLKNATTQSSPHAQSTARPTPRTHFENYKGRRSRGGGEGTCVQGHSRARVCAERR